MCTNSFTNRQLPEHNAERLRIQRLGGYITDQGRVNGSITVVRCLGSPKFQPYVSNLGDFTHRPITDNTEYLILASDGLWKVLSSHDAMAIVETSKQTYSFFPFIQNSCDGCFRSGNLKLAATRLRDAAFQLGSADNITVIVIDFKCED